MKVLLFAPNIYIYFFAIVSTCIDCSVIGHLIIRSNNGSCFRGLKTQSADCQGWETLRWVLLCALYATDMWAWSRCDVGSSEARQIKIEYAVLTRIFILVVVSYPFAPRYYNHGLSSLNLLWLTPHCRAVCARNFWVSIVGDVKLWPGGNTKPVFQPGFVAVSNKSLYKCIILHGTKFLGYVWQLWNRWNWMKSMLGMHILRTSP